MSQLVRVGEIIQMRADAQAVTMPGTAVISRYTSTSDGMGGQTDAYAPVGTAVCRVGEKLSPVERQIADKLTALQVWAITLPATTDVTAKDRIAVSGTTYDVLGVYARESVEVARRALCVELA